MSLSPASSPDSPRLGLAPPLAPGGAGVPALWLGVNVALVALLFGERFVQLVGVWLKDPNYSHGFFVPVISGWLAWRYFQTAGKPTAGEIGPGIAAVVAGCITHLFAVILGLAVIDFVALALVLRGLAVCVGGRPWASGFTFPILFLFFMFPLPGLLTAFAALWLQNWVSTCSATVLELFTVCHQRGHALLLAGVNEPLVVAAECSGLRQIVAFVALGALIGYLGLRTGWGRVLLLLAAVPVAILANVARVLLMAAGAMHFGTGWLSGWLHTAPALVTLPLGLALFGLVAWGLSSLEGKPRNVNPLPAGAPETEVKP
jgi:exosortase